MTYKVNNPIFMKVLNEVFKIYKIRIHSKNTSKKNIDISPIG